MNLLAVLQDPTVQIFILGYFLGSTVQAIFSVFDVGPHLIAFMRRRRAP